MGAKGSDGYFWIMGRIDDVINVAGHRLGTAEIESALVSHERWRIRVVLVRIFEGFGDYCFVTLESGPPERSKEVCACSPKEFVSFARLPISSASRSSVQRSVGCARFERKKHKSPTLPIIRTSDDPRFGHAVVYTSALSICVPGDVPTLDHVVDAAMIHK